MSIYKEGRNLREIAHWMFYNEESLSKGKTGKKISLHLSKNRDCHLDSKRCVWSHEKFYTEELVEVIEALRQEREQTEIRVQTNYCNGIFVEEYLSILANSNYKKEALFKIAYDLEWNITIFSEHKNGDEYGHKLNCDLVVIERWLQGDGG